MYVITGVNGYIGNLVAEHVLASAGPTEVIVTTRSEETAQAWRDRGVDARIASYDDLDALTAAFAGGDRLFMVSGMEAGPKRQQQHRNAVAAATAAGIQHIVYTSFNGTERDEVNSHEVADHKLTERLIQESGATWNVLRNNQYADAMAENPAAMAIVSGQSIGNGGDGRVGFVARDDVAEVAAAILLGAGEPNTGYDVTGPEALSYAEVGALISELSGAPITVIDLTDDEMYAMWDSLGVPRESTGDFSNSPVPWCSDGMVTFGQMIRAGHLDRVTDVVQRFTGHAPQSLRELMVQRQAAWPPVPAAGA